MKSGKIFETVTRLIYESLNDNPSTEIFENKKIDDLSGASREFDIIIKSDLFGSELHIAIECKDHRRSIERSYIDAFNSKCAAIPKINKKIFISKNGFQKGAIEGAKFYGIELFNLNTLDQANVFDWLSIKNVQAYMIDRRITDIEVRLETTLKSFEPDDQLIINSQLSKMSLFDFLNEEIKGRIDRNVYEETQTNLKRQTKTHNLEIEPTDVEILRDGIQAKIYTIKLQVTDTPTPINSQVISNKLNQNSPENKSAEIISFVSERGDITSFVKKDDSVQILSKIKVEEYNREYSEIIRDIQKKKGKALPGCFYVLSILLVF